MKLFRCAWNFLIALTMLACFKENKFFQSSILLVIKSIKVIVTSIIEIIKTIPTS